MKATQAAFSSHIQTVEHNCRRMISVNGFLIGGLLLLVLALMADLFQWMEAMHQSLPPMRPSLVRVLEPLVAIPSLNVPPTLFHIENPTVPATTSTPHIAPESEWKVAGISLGTTRRAFLQDAEGKKSIWVTEGEEIGPYHVKEIRDHSVILETGGNSYEIRM